jgi:hypothetical protein
MSDDSFFEQLAGSADLQSGPAAPGRLKSKIYTALLRRQQVTGSLMSLSETSSGLCVFEKLVEISPLNEKAKSLNFCAVCHARLLAERIEGAPIYWANCPYARFQGH